MSKCWRGLLVAVLLAIPMRVFAHAQLVRSVPAADATVVSSPEWIRLWFSEAPEPSMTRVTLTDSTGAVIAIGSVELQPTNALELKVKVRRTLLPGRYTVAWATAGPDGHPSHGSFAFIVAAPAFAAEDTARDHTELPNVTMALPATVPTAESAAAMDITSAWHVTARTLEFAALLAAIGVVVFQLAVVSRAAIDGECLRHMSSSSAGVGAIAALALLASAALRVLLQWRMMSAMADDVSMRAMSATHWSHALVYQVLATVAALIGFIFARRGVRLGWRLAGLAAAALTVSPALGGHAAASPNLTTLGIVIDTLHVAGASGWLGSLLCVLTIGVPIALGAEQRWHCVATLIAAFSPVALICAGLTAVTGLGSAWLRLGSIDALTKTPYGQVLIIKLVALSALAITGAYNWRRVKPSLGTAAATGRLRTLGTIELAIGCVIIIVTAILVALPTPVSGF